VSLLILKEIKECFAFKLCLLPEADLDNEASKFFIAFLAYCKGVCIRDCGISVLVLDTVRRCLYLAKMGFIFGLSERLR